MKFVHGRYIGSMQFLHYDTTTSKFLESFPPHFVKYMKEKDRHIEQKLVDPTEDEMLLWGYTIIKWFDEMKEEFSVSNVISEDRKIAIQNLFAAQSDFLEFVAHEDIDLLKYEPSLDADEANIVKTLQEKFNVERTWFDLVKDMFTSSVSKVKELFGDFKNTMNADGGYRWGLAIAAALLNVLPYLLSRQLGKTEKCVPQSAIVTKEVKDLIVHETCAHSFSVAAANQTLYMELQMMDGVVFKTLGMMSGHKIVLPSHNVLGGNTGHISVFSVDGSGCLIDNMKFEVEYVNYDEDVSVLSLPTNIPAYFKNMKSGFDSESINSTKLSLGALGNVTTVKRSTRILPSEPIIYSNAKYAKTFNLKNTYMYDIQMSGLCGAMLSNEHGKILGMHVAGNNIENVGVSVIWSAKTRENIYNALNRDDKFISSLEIQRPIGTSGFKLNKKEYKNALNKTDYVPSPLYGVFPVKRQPAVLDVEGRHTIKTFAKKAYDKSHNLDVEAFKFAKDAMRVYMSEYTDLPETEVVKGNAWLAGLNKDSSNGYKCSKKKEDYIDFSSASFTDKLKNEMAKMEEDIKAGVYVDEDWFWEESLKDELRNDGKHLKPRTFRVARVHNQVFMKRIFGNLVQNIMKERKFNQIMIGVNPFEEWAEMYDNLVTCSGVWAGDIGSYDGKMLPQVQEAIHDLLTEFYTGSSPELCSFLLRDMYNTSVVVNDDLWRTTHSMPSGSYLTAMVNSLVNRFYTLMWYFNNTENPSVLDFVENVVDYVYGDDKLNGIRVIREKDSLNAITMEQMFKSIGMTFTTASKGVIEKPFESLEEVSFLKRYFRYHPVIKRVMCPLDPLTLESGLSWVNSKKEQEVVIKDKIATFQREMFLHGPEYFNKQVNTLRARCIEEGISFVELPESYLSYVYTHHREVIKGLSWGGSKYV